MGSICPDLGRRRQAGPGHCARCRKGMPPPDPRWTPRIRSRGFELGPLIGDPTAPAHHLPPDGKQRAGTLGRSGTRDSSPRARERRSRGPEGDAGGRGWPRVGAAPTMELRNNDNEFDDARHEHVAASIVPVLLQVRGGVREVAIGEESEVEQMGERNEVRSRRIRARKCRVRAAVLQ